MHAAVRGPAHGRRLLKITLVCALTVALFGSAASSSFGTPPARFDSWTGTPDPGGATPGDGRGTHFGEGSGDPRSGRSRAKLKKSCKKKRGKRVCKYRRGAKLVKTCVKRKGRKQRCRRAGRSSTAAAGRQAEAASLRNHGLTDPIMPAVGRFYWAPRGGWCSGTLVRPGIVLTAAHCLYADQHAGADNGGATNFYMQDAGAIDFVPGNYVSGGQGVAPYGVWRVARSWVPQGWTATGANQDQGLDWGVVELAPDANGNYPGTTVGTWSAYWGASLPVGTHFYNVGYPASGGFNTAEWSFGNGQYFCDSTWDGLNDNNGPLSGQSWAILNSPCYMNGGSSGGPVFAEFNDGSWGIVGVNNLADSAGNAPGRFATINISFWLDDRFGQFWNSIFNAGSAKASSASRTTQAVSSGTTEAVSSSRKQNYP
jgi:hypothetical protein